VPDEEVLIHEFANEVPRTVWTSGQFVSDLLPGINSPVDEPDQGV